MQLLGGNIRDVCLLRLQPIFRNLVDLYVLYVLAFGSLPVGLAVVACFIVRV
jgi:hypothetical protein